MAQSVMVSYGHLPSASAAILTPTSPVTYAVTQQHPTNQRILGAAQTNPSNTTTLTTTAGRATKRQLGSSSIAESNTSTPVDHTNASRCKRRIQFASLGYVQLPPALPASVARRNARERNRVKQVNSGFAILRSHIPNAFCTNTSSKHHNSSENSSSSGKGRKVSKVDTLRCAVEYIRSLQELLDENDGLVMTGTTTSTTTTTTQPGVSGSENTLPSIIHHGPNPSHTLNSPPLSHGNFLSSSASSLSSASSIISSATMITNNGMYHQHPAASSAALLNPMTLAPHSLSPSCSSNASSPTPSYGSEGSSYITAPSWDHYEPCYAGKESVDRPEPMSASDDELLDAISWWQQSQ